MHLREIKENGSISFRSLQIMDGNKGSFAILSLENTLDNPDVIAIANGWCLFQQKSEVINLLRSLFKIIKKPYCLLDIRSDMVHDYSDIPKKNIIFKREYLSTSSRMLNLVLINISTL